VVAGLKRTGRWASVGMQVGGKPWLLRAMAEGKARVWTASAWLLRRKVRRVCGPMLSPRANPRRFHFRRRRRKKVRCKRVHRSSGRGGCRLR
jgi:hypothetical protein